MAWGDMDDGETITLVLDFEVVFEAAEGGNGDPGVPRRVPGI